MLTFSHFSVVFVHYIKRMLRNPLNLLILVGLPLGIILINTLALANTLPEGLAFSDLPAALFITLLITLSFQFFSSEMLLEFLNYDFRGEVKNRLFMAPVPRLVYLFAVTLASLLVSLVQGLLIFMVMMIGFGLSFGPVYIWLPALFLISLLAQLIAVLIVLFTKTKQMGTSISMGVGFGLMALSGGLFIPVNVIPPFLYEASPVTLARYAILEGGSVALTNLSILGGLILLAGLMITLRSKFSPTF